MVCSQNDIYLSGGGVQATLRNSHRWPLSLSYRRPSSLGRMGRAVVIGVVGSEQRHAVDQSLATTARDLPNVHHMPNVHGARCATNPIDAKAQFPALSPGHHTFTYDDIVIEHVDFYGSVHTLPRHMSMDATSCTETGSLVKRAVSS